MQKHQQFYLQAILNSYSMVFFSQDKFLAIILLLATFFNPLAGLAGLASVVFAVLFFTFSGHKTANIQSGIYGFNSLLLGIGFGTYYQFNVAFCLWLIIVGVVNCVLTVIWYAKTKQYNFPVLSLPFIISFWLILTAATSFPSLGLVWQNSNLSSFNFAILNLNFHLPFYIDLFFRAVSAVIFQNNVLTGFVISIGILVHSRIGFSLLIIGFASACLFNYFTEIYPEGINYYHLGANFMMIALATGSFFLIPSARAYGWAVAGVVICFLFLAAFAKVFIWCNLPMFSLPFCVVSFMLLCFFRLRTKTGELQLVTVQHYSPETNLYLYLSHQKRLQDLQFLKLDLPFMGSWKVSQGYGGSITHKNEWSQALDFVVVDGDDRTFQFPGTKPAHFYSFNKPVLACADGTVAELVNDVEDNAIGETNLLQNWGNTVIIKHLDGLYSKVSHLKKYSVKVAKGDLVKQGTILGFCGNSGRSPEPHLHFQLQTTPYIGSKTLAYPFGYFVENSSAQTLKTFKTPAENDQIKALDIDFAIKKAFDFQPGFSIKVNSEKRIETWEIYTDALHQKHIYSTETGAAAYFVNDGTAFYFTSFYGDKKSMLYQFFMAAFKVIFTTDPLVKATDQFPMNISKNWFSGWLQDFAAPFFRFVSYNYQSKAIVNSAGMRISAEGFTRIFNQEKEFFSSEIDINDQKITGFSICTAGKLTTATWQIENI